MNSAQKKSPWLFLFAALALTAIAVATLPQSACNRSPGGDGGSPGGSPGGSEDASGDGTGTLACSLNGAGSGPTGNNPSDFPTIAGIDFSAFPVDPGTCSGARVFHVATTGSDTNLGTEAQPYRTIVHALDVAGGGDAVWVHAGSYAEGADGEYRSLVISKNGQKLCAAPGETVTVTRPSAAFNYGIHVTADNVVLDGINVSGFPNVIEMGNEPGSTVSNLVIKNLVATAGGTGFKNGIVSSVARVNGLLLKNVQVRNASLGISCNEGPCNNWRLDGVAVCNAGNAAGESGADAIAVEVRDEQVAAGQIAQNFLISNAEVTGASGDGIDLKAARVAVYNSRIHDNARNGIKFWRGGDLVNSFVVGHGADASVVFDREGTYRILNSLVAYHNVNSDGTLRGDSYTLTSCYDFASAACPLTIVNSVFYNNSGSIFLSNGTTATIQNSLLGNSLNDVIIEKAPTMVQETDAPTALSNLATASGNLAFSTNPGFTNPGAQDFTFGAASPLRDKGTAPSQFPSRDYRGNPRNQGAAPDLGPLELY